MEFSLTDKNEIIEILRSFASRSSNEERKQNVAELLKMIDSNQLKVFFGFANQYGEKYLCVGNSMANGDYWWVGDESDWDAYSAWHEDEYIFKVMNDGYYQEKLKLRDI